MKKNSSKVLQLNRTRPEQLDAYTPPGAQPRDVLANAPRYLVTAFDTPLAPDVDEHTEFLLALFSAAKLLRKQAMHWRDDIDWSGTTGETSEADIEERFRKADNCDREAKSLLDEYRRGCRRAWIATFPRKGPQYRKAAQS